MTTVQRYLYVNPIEPEPMSMRIPSDIDTRVEVAFHNMMGPLNVDIGAQIALTGRTGGPRLFYPMPATDVVNGKALALIPANDLTDPNGYRLHLYGTIDGDLRLLASGTVVLIPGTTAMNAAEQPDVIDQVPITLIRQQPAVLTVTLWDDLGSDPFDLATSTVAAAIYERNGGLLLQPFTVEQIDVNVVRCTLTADQIDTLPDDCYWNLQIGQVSGVTTLVEGPVSVVGAVDAPLPTLVANWSYRKPDDDVPLAGEMVQSNFVRNVLKIAVLDNDGNDTTATLSALRAGDTITDGTVTWTVQADATQPDAAWYEVLVLPLTQLATEGVTSFTISRPTP